MKVCNNPQYTGRSFPHVVFERGNYWQVCFLELSAFGFDSQWNNLQVASVNVSEKWCMAITVISTRRSSKSISGKLGNFVKKELAIIYLWINTLFHILHVSLQSHKGDMLKFLLHRANLNLLSLWPMKGSWLKWPQQRLYSVVECYVLFSRSL